MDSGVGRGTQHQAIPEDAVLVEALRRGDETAFATLVERYHPTLLRLATAYVHDRALAEEVTQDAWLGMLQGVHRFAGRASLRTWLFRILVNCARSGLRREGRAIPFSDLGDLDDDDAPSVDPERFHPPGHRWAWHWSAPPAQWPDEQMLGVELEAFLRKSIAALPPQQQAVLTLRDLDGLPAQAACEVLGISAANQRVLLHRARSRVRNDIESYLARDQEEHHGRD